MLCDHLEGWDREGGRETQKGGDMGIYVYVYLIHFVIKQKLNTILKQLYSNTDIKKKIDIQDCLSLETTLELHFFRPKL